MNRLHTQADDRRDTVCVDQFGRKWLAALERKTFEPTGGIFKAGWDDPLETHQRYLKAPRDAFGNPQMGQIRVDFEGWIKDQQTALQEWKQRLWDIGQEKQQNKFDAKTAEQDEYLLHLTGPKPWPSHVVLLKAMSGHKGYLGLAPMTKEDRVLLGRLTIEDLQDVAEPSGTDVTPRAASYREFIREEMKAGKTMAQAAEAWQQVKQAAQAVGA